MSPTRPRPEILYAGMSTFTQEMKAAIPGGGSGNWWKGFPAADFATHLPGIGRLDRGAVLCGGSIGTNPALAYSVLVLLISQPCDSVTRVHPVRYNRLRYFASMAWAEALISRATPLKTRGYGIMAATVRDLS